MKTYKLETVDGHLLAHLPQGLSLIDTGSPISMQPPTIVLDTIQRPIKHLLGNDELSRSRILLDSVNGEYAQYVDRIAGEEFPLRPCLGVFQIALTFRDQQWHACLDSGARLSYVAPEAVDGLTPIGSEPDFHPLLGNFDVPVYELSIAVGSRRIAGRFGVLPESLSSLLTMFGLNGWILGSDFFRDRSIILDLDHHLVVDVTETLAHRKRSTTESRLEPTRLSDRARFDNSAKPQVASRPTLTMSTSGALEYHRNSFDNDLRRVIGGDITNWTRLSITSFCPGNQPHVPTYSEPARAFASLEDQCWFLCSLFVTQLVDQASHCATGTVRKVRAGTRGEIRLVGMLGSYWQTIHPAFLLLALSLYRFPVSDDVIADGIRKMLMAELESLGAMSEERDRIHNEVYNALRQAEIPRSLRAFVSDGAGRRDEPDMTVVERLRMAAISEVANVSSKLASV